MDVGGGRVESDRHLKDMIAKWIKWLTQTVFSPPLTPSAAVNIPTKACLFFTTQCTHCYEVASIVPFLREEVVHVCGQLILTGGDRRLNVRAPRDHWKTNTHFVKSFYFALQRQRLYILNGTNICDELSCCSVCHKPRSWQNSARLGENLKGKHEALRFLDTQPNIGRPLHTKTRQWFTSADAHKHSHTFKLTWHFQSSVRIRKLGQRSLGSLVVVDVSQLHLKN